MGQSRVPAVEIVRFLHLASLSYRVDSVSHRRNIRLSTAFVLVLYLARDKKLGETKALRVMKDLALLCT